MSGNIRETPFCQLPALGGLHHSAFTGPHGLSQVWVESQPRHEFLGPIIARDDVANTLIDYLRAMPDKRQVAQAFEQMKMTVSR